MRTNLLCNQHLFRYETFLMKLFHKQNEKFQTKQISLGGFV